LNLRRSAYTERVAETVTVQRHCVSKLGVHRGALAAARVAQWAIATADLGHVPTTVEYVAYWAISERTGWNHRALVHEAFGEDWPRVVEHVAGQLARRKERSPRVVQGLAVA
jgi:hypothetical protein